MMLMTKTNLSNRLSSPIKCLAFARSVLFCEDSDPIIREQVNAITSFIDASNVYGSSDDFALSLRYNMLLFLINLSLIMMLMSRTMSHGLLKQSETNLLPQIDGEYTAGDVRSREMPGLATMHTLWVREHNR